MAAIVNSTSFGGSSDPLTFNLTVSAGTGRVAVVAHLQDAARTYSGVTFDGNAMTNIAGASIIHSSTSPVAYMWYYDIPDNLPAGNYQIAIDLSSGVAATDATAYAWQLSGLATGGPEDSDKVEGASGSTATQTRTLTCTDGAVIVAAACNNDPTITFTWSGDSGIAERIQSNETNFTSTIADAVVSGAGAKVVNAVHSGTAGRKLLIAASFAAVVGPTITVQPVADTVILTNETTATFSVTATGTGGLTYDWELETSVGGGVYANLSDGNGATWTGQTASSCTATLTAKTLSGRRVRCNVTDDNGTTTTNAVALTIYDGPQLTTFPATNGSGVSTATLTCDYVTGVGEAIEVRIPLSDGDVAVTVTTT